MIQIWIMRKFKGVITLPQIEDVPFVPAQNALTTFTFPVTHEIVRVVTSRLGDDKTETPWFVARDVAEVLGYANPSEAVADHCKRLKILKTSKSLPWVPGSGMQIRARSGSSSRVTRKNSRHSMFCTYRGKPPGNLVVALPRRSTSTASRSCSSAVVLSR
jgi:hypothetical protein